jgi:hypothetical protein
MFEAAEAEGQAKNNASLAAEERDSVALVKIERGQTR